ncbi:MAG TPA: aspartyl protease family protein [Pyrinomonadaceae bacterium]|jgi:predicted aspartyl protease/Tfp pilus assembly protein PilF|nr:aspartyl protease family protein [Pyrinomonadaceae bacterium]
MSRTVKLSTLAVAAALAVLLTAGATPGAFASDKKERARAERALREGEFEVAEKIYRELVEKDLKDLTARLGLSYAQYKQRNLRDAYDNAARALAIDATSARAHAILGSTLLASGDFPLSVEEFKTALSFDQNEALAVAGLSMLNFYENRAQAALVGLRRAVELDPNEPDFIFNFAQAAARSERYKESADAYETFLRVAPRTDADRRARIRGLIDFLRFIANQGRLYQTGGSARTEVAFELVNSRPIIPVRLNGSKKISRFVVDTGSGMCVLSNQMAERLGVKPVARGGLARAVGGGGRFEIVYGFLEALQIGEARVSNVPVYIREFHNTQEPVDGYIGLSVLSHFLSTVDYGERAFSLVRDDARPAPGVEQATTGAPSAPTSPAAASPTPQRAFEVPIRSTSSGFWSGLVRVEGVSKPTNFIIDTGATVSVVSTQLAERETLSRFEQKFRLSVYGAAGVTEDVPLLMLPRISLGDYTHANVAAAVLDMNPINETSGFEQAGILGGNVLRYFRVTFDFQRAVIRLEMIPNFIPAPISKEANVTPQGLE